MLLYIFLCRDILDCLPQPSSGFLNSKVKKGVHLPAKAGHPQYFDPIFPDKSRIGSHQSDRNYPEEAIFGLQ
jgi:hypothetical protein